MTQGIKKDIDGQILHILGKINDEYEIIKRQGFPAHVNDLHYRHYRSADATIPENRWRIWINELGIDYVQLVAILKIIQNEGLLEKFEFISEFV